MWSYFWKHYRILSNIITVVIFSCKVIWKFYFLIFASLYLTHFYNEYVNSFKKINQSKLNFLDLIPSPAKWKGKPDDPRFPLALAFCDLMKEKWHFIISFEVTIVKMSPGNFHRTVCWAVTRGLGFREACTYQGRKVGTPHSTREEASQALRGELAGFYITSSEIFWKGMHHIAFKS